MPITLWEGKIGLSSFSGSKIYIKMDIQDVKDFKQSFDTTKIVVELEDPGQSGVLSEQELLIDRRVDIGKLKEMGKDRSCKEYFPPLFGNFSFIQVDLGTHFWRSVKELSRFAYGLLVRMKSSLYGRCRMMRWDNVLISLKKGDLGSRIDDAIEALEFWEEIETPLKKVIGMRLFIETMDTQASSYIHNETVQEFIQNQQAAQLEALWIAVSGTAPLHQQRALSHTMDFDVTMGDSSTQHQLSPEAIVRSESNSQTTVNQAAHSMSTMNMRSLLQLGPSQRSIAQRARRQREEALRVSATQRDHRYPPSLTHGLTMETAVHYIDATSFVTTTQRADKGNNIVIADTLSPQPYINSQPVGPSYAGCSSGATQHEHFPLPTRNFSPSFHLGSSSLRSNM
ncbi:hypothetical protein IFM89_003533 [Coptis chinensis]|uniref:Uncharacterized protein n=1 Tax=Coptis chinensis TaxID=261450 RepID=A0A835LAS7_9MAGN|nr:hypothetical protein IFM89_003533 [Coptis chinensis]